MIVEEIMQTKKNQLNQNTQHNYNEIRGKMIWMNNVDLVFQMVGNNEIRDLSIVEKNIAQKEYKSK